MGHPLVRILDGDVEVARHVRSWDIGQQIETEAHLAALAREKRKARDHRGRDRLAASCPAARAFLEEALRNGVHLGGTTTRLLHLLERYGATDLDAAIVEAHARGAFAARSVAHILDQRARARGERPHLPLVLPTDPRVRDLVVTPHSLERYDRISVGASDSDRLELTMALEGALQRRQQLRRAQPQRPELDLAELAEGGITLWGAAMAGSFMTAN